MAYNMGSSKQVFIDWDLIEPGYGVGWGGERPESWEMPHGVQIAVHPPRIDPQPIICADRPWESKIGLYCTVLEDEGRYRLYYDCYFGEETGPEGTFREMLAYAESTDGVNWVKPKVGTVDFMGSTDNNLVFGLGLSLGRQVEGSTVFKDPSASPAERYKLVHKGREDDVVCVFGAVSPDGLRWKALEKPLIRDYMCDSQTVVAFDQAKGRYVGYFRGWKGFEYRRWHGKRTIAYAESDRFDSWPVPQTIIAPDVHDGPDTDIYTNAYTRWPGTADAHLMFPTFYRRTPDLHQVHLMTSRNGLLWQRLRREAVIQGGEPGSGWEGGVYAGCGLISISPGEWSLPIAPVGHSHNQDLFEEGRRAHPPHRSYLCKAVWREDGFTSLEAESEGMCSTVPLTFAGRRLQINAWTRFGGGIRVAVANSSGESFSGVTFTGSDPIPGLTFADCDPVTGDIRKRIVTWNGSSDLSRWTGEVIRLRLWLCRARLHSVQFV